MAESRAAMATGLSGSVEGARISDLLWLALALALLIGTGVGIRDPWPADEPRFALIAREMVHTGEWLFPRIGGDLYPDKPPVYFWLLSICYWLTGSLKASFLIPAFVSSLVVVGLVYDLGRRLAGRASGLAAGLTLASTIQFVMTMRGAQIDPVLCALTTLSLYGLLRHLILGPAWGWYFVGGVAAGVGVVTKGVGFLPLLVLIPYAVLRVRGFSFGCSAPEGLLGEPSGAGRLGGGISGGTGGGASGTSGTSGTSSASGASSTSSTSSTSGGVGVGGWRWGLVAVGFLLGVSIWLAPMLIAVATRNDPALTAYQNEILFHQTVNRYASAWHHLKPWYFFIVEVIPGLWLPMSLLLFWLVPRWKGAWKERDGRVWVPLAWALLTLLFFSLSAGKRGIYLFPALPAVAIAAAPFLPALFERKGVQRAGLILAAGLLVGAAALLIAEATGHPKLHALLSEQGIESLAPIAIFLGVGLALWALAFWKKPILAWPALLIGVAGLWSYGITPVINGERSARDFMKEMQSLVPQDTELGLLSYKEQFLLYLDRPIVNFGHARWREGEQEAYDASVWLNGSPGRTLLIPESAVTPCFVSTTKQPAGTSSGDGWLLVKGEAAASCVQKGDGTRAIRYRPPVFVHQ